VVPKVLAQLRGLVHRVGAFRIDLVKVPRFGGKGDSEPPRVGSDLRLIRTLRRRRPIWISDLRTSGRVEQGRAIADRSCNGVRDGHPAPPLTRIRAHWGARTGWVEAEQPAARGGDTDRSPAVITIGHWNHVRRDCGGRTAARATCAILEVGPPKAFLTLSHLCEVPSTGSFHLTRLYACFLRMRNHSLVKQTTGQFTRIPVVLTGPPPGLTNKPVSLLNVTSSPSVISFR
jgi:hypothetical protein